MSDMLVSDEEVTGAWPAFASQADDERARLIALATRTVEAYVGRQLGRGTVTQAFRPENARTVLLRVTPIESITSVTSGHPGVVMDADAYSIRDADLGVVEFYQGFSAGFRFPDRTYGGDPRSGQLVILYEGGWETADVPADIKQACILTIRFGVAQATVQNGGYYESVQQGSYSFKISTTNSMTTSTSGLSSEALGLVRNYRRVRPA